MRKKKSDLFPIKILAAVFIGLGLMPFLYGSIVTIADIFERKELSPYLFEGFIPYLQIFIICICIAVFVLMLLFNIRAKNNDIFAIVNVIVIVALCNPITWFFSAFVTTDYENYYEIKSEADFNTCALDMRTDFNYFPRYSEFDENNVRFVGKVNSNLFFYQSFTAIVKYDTLELCETDYRAYLDSHQFLTEPVIERNDTYLIAAPEFHYEGIFFKVVTAGEKDFFPNIIYMIGIDRDNSTLYYLYLNDQDLDYVAESDAKDLKGEMRELIAERFNLGK